MTGAVSSPARLQTTVARVTFSYLTAVQLALWGGVACDLTFDRAHALSLVPLIAIGLLNLAVEAPLVRDAARVRPRRLVGRHAATPVAVR